MSETESDVRTMKPWQRKLIPPALIGCLYLIAEMLTKLPATWEVAMMAVLILALSAAILIAQFNGYWSGDNAE